MNSCLCEFQLLYIFLCNQKGKSSSSIDGEGARPKISLQSSISSASSCVIPNGKPPDVYPAIKAKFSSDIGSSNHSSSSFFFLSTRFFFLFRAKFYTPPLSYLLEFSEISPTLFCGIPRRWRYNKHTQLLPLLYRDDNFLEGLSTSFHQANKE